jgi:two-component system, LytTR family, response regulator
MHKINTIIISKNDAQKNKIENFVRRSSWIHVVDSYSSIMEAYHVLAENDIKIIFTDEQNHSFHKLLNNGKITSLPLVINPVFEKDNKTLKKNIIINVSFSAYHYYESIRSLKKIIEQLELSVDNPFWVTPSVSEDTNGSEQKHIFIRTNHASVKIFLDEIIYIKAMENFVQVVSQTGTYTTLVTLKNILSKLPAHQFMQIHRSYVINLEKVKLLEKKSVKVDKYDIPVGGVYKNGLTAALLQSKVIK